MSYLKEKDDAPPAWLKDLLAALPQSNGLTAADLKAIVEGAGINTADAMKKSLRPENLNPPPNSVYHPLGVEKPELSRDTFVCHVQQRADTCSPEEIRAFNAIQHDCEVREKRWSAKVERNGTTERLFIDFPCKSIDDRMELPSIVLICRELAGGSAAVDLTALSAEVTKLRAELAAK